MNHILKVLRFGLPYLRRYWIRLAAGVLFGILFGATSATFVWGTKTLIGRMAPETEARAHLKKEKPGREQKLDRIKAELDRRTREWVDPWLPYAGRPVDWRQVLGGLLLFPALVAVRGIMAYLSAYCMAWVGEQVVNDLRTDVLIRLSTLSLDYFNRATMGDMVTHVNGDTATLQRCLRVGCADLVQQPMTAIGVLVALCVIDWRLTLAAMIFFPACVIPVVVMGRRARLAARASTKVGVTQASLLYEILSGIRVVKAFGLEAMQVERFRRFSRQLVRQNLKGVRAKELVNPIIETVSVMGFGLLVVYITYQNRPVSDMVGFLTGLIFFYTPVKKVAQLHVMFEQTAFGVQRLLQIMTERPTVKEAAAPRRLLEFKSGVVFDQVSFSYGREPVLRELSLEIPRGTRLGVAGESGSGKSTLVNLLFRFFDPVQGVIRIDGVDLRQIANADLRQLMALVSQDIVLFDMTVAENIALGREGATREQIEAAARAAFVHEFILSLPQGYETRIGERGVTLSGGQRQRLCIARAFIRNAPILVLDEATASLDSKAEAEVQAAIDRLAEHRTVIAVAHRLSTLAAMDRVIVLAEGRIVESGGFDELLLRGGVFASMAARQGILPSGGSAEIVEI
ncbi:MAG TPA: ABC transporter ATP-binding protein [Candidatus Paceibacterota bacterium]|nr:multidrug ABC transporter ATP-binding protein [Limisphaerales bacterium]HNR70231.1 ABC transporter ATP-binding protein [Verrucomicrobiota bacterium]HRY58122.1 ABC transporter ATP-binding protein [Candidatus Paceibacterota bacterium]HNS68675.1 ABC transporter ATP-binding protein [Verrucomicrobiota bacterium]HOW77866.1 ABC transporter ATP-binding protein [Verrucomicrobiota bacterium]